MPDTIPPATPTGLQAIPTDNRIHLTWTANNEKDLGGYLIYISETDRFTAPPIDAGTATTYTLKNLTNDKIYYIALAAYDKQIQPNISLLTEKITATPSDENAPNPPIGFRAVASAGVITLSWINPVDADFQGIEIYRFTSGAPNRAMANLIYRGNSTDLEKRSSYTLFKDTEALIGVQYRYAIYAFDEGPLYSKEATANAILTTP